MPNPPALATPPATAPTSPTSPTSTFVAPLGQSYQDVDLEKADGLVQEPDTIQKGSNEGGLQRRLTDSLKRYKSFMSSPRTLSSHRKSDADRKLVQRIEDHPEGYPQLAAFINSDEKFMICRKYGFLRSRVLLHRQDELRQLERDLLEADQEDAQDCPLALRSRKTDEERPQDEYSRKPLIEKIDAKLHEYDSTVKELKNYLCMKAPSPRNLKSFVAWMQNEAPLTQEESDFLEHQDDFVAVSSEQEAGWLDGVVEDTLKWCMPKKIRERLFTSKEQVRKSNDPYVHLISKYRVDMLVRLILTITTVGLLVGPSAVLFTVSGHGTMKILLILLFTLLFSAAVSLFTKARRHEMLAATATAQLPISQRIPISHIVDEKAAVRNLIA